MAYKKQARTNTDVFGTFLSNVSGDSSSSDSSLGASADSLVPDPSLVSTPDSVAVAVLLYLLENGPQPAGALLSGVGMPLQDFFVATQSMQSRQLITSSQSDDGETFDLTDEGRGEAERWKSMLGFMQK